MTFSAQPTFESLSEVRQEIDRLDRQIVSLISQRAHCVNEAARFKKDERDVAAPERFASMLLARRQWAEESGLSPDMIEKLYRDIVAHFIGQETEHWRALQASNANS